MRRQQFLDYAVGGATTGIGNIGDGGTPTAQGPFLLPGMQQQIGAYLGSHAVIVAGLNGINPGAGTAFGAQAQALSVGFNAALAAQMSFLDASFPTNITSSSSTCSRW